MRNIKYAIEDIIRRPFIFFIIVIQIVVATMILTTGLCWSVKTMDTVSRTKNMFKDREIYGLLDDTDRNYIQNSVNKADGMDRMYKLYTFLRENNDFSVCSQGSTNIIIKDFTDKDKFYYGTADKKYLNNPYPNIEGHFSNIKGFYVDDGYVKEFPLEVSSGRTFEEQDYSSEDMPVILGSEYKGIYNVGDTFDYFDYTNKKIRKLEVIGILKSNTYSFSMGEAQSLDNFVIYPYQTITPSTSNKEMYDGWINHCTVITNDKDKALEEIRKESSDLELYNFRLNSWKSMTIRLIQSNSEEAMKSILLSIAIFLFVSVGIVAVQLNRIKSSLREFGIHLLSGARKRDIEERIILSTIMYVIIGSVLGTYFGYVTNKQIYDTRVILFIIPIMILLMIIILILPLNKIRKMEITNIIRREE